MSERLDRSVAGNNSDTAACGVRNDDVRDEIGSPKAAAFTLPPHRTAADAAHTGSFMRRRHRRRRRRRHTRDCQIRAPTVRRSDWSTAAVTLYGYGHSHTRATDARIRAHTDTHSHTHTHTRARAQRAHVSSRVGSCRVSECVRSSESVRCTVPLASERGSPPQS